MKPRAARDTSDGTQSQTHPMQFHSYGNKAAPSLMLLPGLGVSYEIFLPLIELLRSDFHIIAVEVDGFMLGTYARFTSIDDQAAQANGYVKAQLGGLLDCAYGLSMGGKILSRMMERAEIAIDHAILDGAPFAAVAPMAERTAPALPVSERMDVLPLERILEAPVPCPLLRRSAGRVPESVALR
ncbi:MAG: alpha/beta hydrolase [Bacteroidales bacterium]|nr:alpha/beta hydrolase [Bacteroidales bacterium]